MNAFHSDTTALGHGDLDDVFSTLAATIRRYVLWTLARSSDPLSEATLVEAVVDRELTSAGPMPDEHRDTATRIELHHVHLPKLVDQSFVEATASGYRLTPAGERAAALVGQEFAPDADE
jgi:hypothetical protein